MAKHLAQPLVAETPVEVFDEIRAHLEDYLAEVGDLLEAEDPYVHDMAVRALDVLISLVAYTEDTEEED